jgi:hypothetical protein
MVLRLSLHGVLQPLLVKTSLGLFGLLVVEVLMAVMVEALVAEVEVEILITQQVRQLP